MAAETFFYPPGGGGGGGSSGPIEFILDGVATEVSEDTGTPANSVPLPVRIFGSSGPVFDYNYGDPSEALRTAAQLGNASGVADFNAGNVSAQTLRVVIASDQGAVAVSQSGTWNINNISGTISLPTGAATAAKQPALGTAGSASSDVITIQGITSMTPVEVSGTVAATQSGSWTISGGGGGTTATNSAVATVATGAAAQLIASNSGRKYVIISNFGQVPIFIGDSATTDDDGANPGCQIGPGDSFAWDSTAAVYATAKGFSNSKIGLVQFT